LPANRLAEPKETLMALHIRYITTAAAGTALLGLAAYAAFKSGALRPVLVGTIRGGIKASDWIGRKAAGVKQGVMDMVDEAKAEQQKPTAATSAVAKPAATATAAAKPKPAAKSAPAPAA
jgi:hypothetical protein